MHAGVVISSLPCSVSWRLLASSRHHDPVSCVRQSVHCEMNKFDDMMSRLTRAGKTWCIGFFPGSRIPMWNLTTLRTLRAPKQGHSLSWAQPQVAVCLNFLSCHSNASMAGKWCSGCIHASNPRFSQLIAVDTAPWQACGNGLARLHLRLVRWKSCSQGLHAGFFLRYTAIA